MDNQKLTKEIVSQIYTSKNYKITHAKKANCVIQDTTFPKAVSLILDDIQEYLCLLNMNVFYELLFDSSKTNTFYRNWVEIDDIVQATILSVKKHQATLKSKNLFFSRTNKYVYFLSNFRNLALFLPILLDSSSYYTLNTHFRYIQTTLKINVVKNIIRSSKNENKKAFTLKSLTPFTVQRIQDLYKLRFTFGIQANDPYIFYYISEISKKVDWEILQNQIILESKYYSKKTVVTKELARQRLIDLKFRKLIFNNTKSIISILEVVHNLANVVISTIGIVSRAVMTRQKKVYISHDIGFFTITEFITQYFNKSWHTQPHLIHYFSETSMEKAFETQETAQIHLLHKNKIFNGIGILRSVERPQYIANIFRHYLPNFILNKPDPNNPQKVELPHWTNQNIIENSIIKIFEKIQEINTNLDNSLMEIESMIETAEKDIPAITNNLSSEELDDISHEVEIQKRKTKKQISQKKVNELKKLKKMVLKIAAIKRHMPIAYDDQGNILPNQIRFERQALHYNHYAERIKNMDNKLLDIDITCLDEIKETKLSNEQKQARIQKIMFQKK